MATIQVEHLTCIYKNKHQTVTAVNDVSFSANEGEILVIFGPSGCGKSTLLRAIAGLKERAKGDIFIHGIDIDSIDMKTRNFSYIFQQNNLYTFTTVYNNIAMPLKAAKIDIEEIEKRVEQVANQLKIVPLLSRKPKQLSGGQIQLVALAKALIKNPDFYLFDEPFANLDLTTRILLRQEIKKINQMYAATMIFVTHDINEAYQLGDTVLVMEQGRMIESLSKDAFFQKYSHANQSSLIEEGNHA